MFLRNVFTFRDMYEPMKIIDLKKKKSACDNPTDMSSFSLNKSMLMRTDRPSPAPHLWLRHVNLLKYHVWEQYQTMIDTVGGCQKMSSVTGDHGLSPCINRN